MSELRAALERFGDDATLWDQNSAELAGAQAAAARLAIDSLAFGPAAWIGVAEAYQEVQQSLADRLGEGSQVCATIAQNLINARDGIQASEDANLAALNNATQTD